MPTPSGAIAVIWVSLTTLGGTHGTVPGLFWAVHEFSADTDGNLYTAEVFGGRSQKFKPRAGADPSHIYKPQPLMPKTAGTGH